MGWLCSRGLKLLLTSTAGPTIIIVAAVGYPRAPGVLLTALRIYPGQKVLAEPQDATARGVTLLWSVMFEPPRLLCSKTLL